MHKISVLENVFIIACINKLNWLLNSDIMKNVHSFSFFKCSGDRYRKNNENYLKLYAARVLYRTCANYIFPSFAYVFHYNY